MTVMQVMMQPFGIMNALRGKISVPISATAALAAALTAPKSTALYSFCGELTMSQSNSRHSRHFAEWWTLLVSSFMIFFSVTCFVLLETGRYEGIRAVFDTKPWQNAAPLLEDSDELTKAESKLMCPFTGQEGSGTCPICHSIVSHNGYYHVRVFAFHPEHVRSHLSRREIHPYYTPSLATRFSNTDLRCKPAK